MANYTLSLHDALPILGFMQDAFANAGGPMPLSAATYIASCLLKALDYIHRARMGENGATIVHRDVNPANILLSIADRKSTRLNSSHVETSYAVFRLKK